MLKTSLIAALMIAAGLTAATSSAEARHRHHHHRHFGFGIYAAPVYVAPTYYASDCSYAYVRWQSSGSYHWKRRYYACKGWW